MSEIVVQNLTKRFKDHTVLNHISMKLESGHIYGLVGRNGSGKTMLLKHMLGFLYPDEGYVSIDGKQIGKDVDIPGRVGAIIENPGFLADYSGFQNLRLLAMIRHEISDQNIKDVIRLVDLDPESKKHVGKASF